MKAISTALLLACGQLVPSVTNGVIARNADASLLATDGMFVYYVDTDSHQVLRVPVTGGDPSPMGDVTGGVVALVVDTTNVLWVTTGCQLVRAPRGGGATDIIATGICAKASTTGAETYVVSDGTSVYWVAEAGASFDIMRTSLSNGATKKIAGTDSVHTIAVAAGRVYWTSPRDFSGNGSVNFVAQDGGATVLLATGECLPFGLALDSSRAYWLSQGACSLDAGGVNTAPINGGTKDKLFSGEHGQRLAVIDAMLYWDTEAAPSAVRRASTDGGQVNAAVDLTEDAPTFVLDATSVYWINSSGYIFRAPR